MLSLSKTDGGQRKRLADICEKLGVTLFAGTILQGFIAAATSVLQILAVVAVLSAGTALLGVAVILSKENSP